jgi:hypothetical protein
MNIRRDGKFAYMNGAEYSIKLIFVKDITLKLRNNRQLFHKKIIYLPTSEYIHSLKPIYKKK